MSDTIDNLSIEITSNADKAASSLLSLASSAEKLKGAAKGAGENARDMKDEVQDMGNATQEAGEQSGQAAEKVRDFGNAAKDVGDSAKKSSNPLAAFWNALKRIGHSAISAGIRAISTAIKGVAHGTVTTGLKGAQFAMNGFKNAVTATSKGVATLVSIGFKRLGERITDITKKVTGFVRSIGRIALYRAIRSALKEVTQGFSEGIANLYQWSLLVDRRFADSMDRLAMASLYLKNSVGAMAAPLINAVAPAIDLVVDKLVSAINLANQFFAALTGQSTYTAARRLATTWGDAAESTASGLGRAAKELKKTILGFDELNVLNGDKNTGSGSGSGSSSPATDYRSMFENRTVENNITSFAQRIRNAVNSREWNSLGGLIADKLNSVFTSLNWELLGEKLGEKINILTNVFSSVFANFNWRSLGSRIAIGLVAVKDTVQWEVIGEMYANRINGIFDMIRGFVERFEWGDAGKKFGNAVNALYKQVDWPSIGSTLASLTRGVLHWIKLAIKTFDLSDVGDRFSTTLNAFFRDKATFTEAADTFNESMLGVLELGQSFVDGFQEETAANNIRAALRKIKWADIAKETWGLIKSAFNNAGNFINVLLGGSVDYTRITDSASKIEAIQSRELTRSNESLANSIGTNLANLLNSVFAKESLFAEAGRTFNKTMLNILTFGQAFINGFDEKQAAKDIKTALNEIKWLEIAKSIWSIIKSAFSKAGNFVDALFTADIDYNRAQIDPAYAQRIADYNGKSLGERIRIRLEEALNQIPWKNIASQTFSAAKSVFTTLGESIGAVIADGISSALWGLKMSESKNWSAGDYAVSEALLGGAGSEPGGFNPNKVGSGGLFGSLFNASAAAGIDQYSQAFYDTYLNGKPSGVGRSSVLSDRQSNSLVNDTKNMMSDLLKAFNDGWKAINESVKKSYGDMFYGLFSTFSNAILTTIPNKMQGLLDAMAKGWSEINSVVKTAYANMFYGLFSTFSNAILTTIPNKMSGLNNAFGTGWQRINNTTSTFMTQMQYVVLNAVNNLGGVVPSRFVSLANAIANVGWDGVGRQVVYGIGNGINYAWPWLRTLVYNLANAMYRAARNALGIHSPSKLFSDGVGMMIGLGVAEGIDNSAPVVMDALNSINESMRNSLTPFTGVSDYIEAAAGSAAVQYAEQANGQMDNAREIALLQSMLNEMRRLNEKEFTAEITSSSVQRALNRSNLRAGVTVVPVGN